MREDGTEESQEDGFECHPRKGDQEPWQVFKEGFKSCNNIYLFYQPHRSYDENQKKAFEKERAL